MKAKFINENIGFQKNLNPKDALRVGHKEYIRNKIENDHIWLENWMDELSYKLGGHFTAYLSDENIKELAEQILIDGKDIQLLVMDFDKYVMNLKNKNPDNNSWEYDKGLDPRKYDARVWKKWENEVLIPLQLNGWKIFRDNDRQSFYGKYNNYITEFILTK